MTGGEKLGIVLLFAALATHSLIIGGLGVVILALSGGSH